VIGFDSSLSDIIWLVESGGRRSDPPVFPTNYAFSLICAIFAINALFRRVDGILNNIQFEDKLFLSHSFSIK
jgi:hypothetical protein